MIRRRLRGVLVCGIGALVVAAPLASQACCWLDNLFGRTCARTTYAPPMPVVAAAPCATQTCGYVPQTCYQTYYRPVPVLAYRPVATCDPCSGCATTAYRPVQTWAYQACLVPYTSYRVAYSNPCPTSCAPCSVGGCSPCGAGGRSPCSTGSCGATYGTPTYGATSGCSSCSAPAATTTYPAPTPAIPQPSRDGMSLPPSLPVTPAPATVTPPPSNNTPAAPPAASNGGGSSTSSLRPVPMQQSYQRQALPGVPTNEPGPQWNIRVPTQPAEAPNRTTARPIYRAAYYQPVSARPSTSYNPAGLDDSGWRPARD